MDSKGQASAVLVGAVVSALLVSLGGYLLASNQEGLKTMGVIAMGRPSSGDIVIYRTVTSATDSDVDVARKYGVPGPNAHARYWTRHLDYIVEGWPNCKANGVGEILREAFSHRPHEKLVEEGKVKMVGYDVEVVERSYCGHSPRSYEADGYLLMRDSKGETFRMYYDSDGYTIKEIWAMKIVEPYIIESKGNRRKVPLYQYLKAIKQNTGDGVPNIPWTSATPTWDYVGEGTPTAPEVGGVDPMYMFAYGQDWRCPGGRTESSWEKPTAEIETSVNPSNSGFVRISPSRKVRAGTKVEISPDPNPGYSFVRWSGDINTEEKSPSLRVWTDVDVVGEYSKGTVSYKLTTDIKPNDAGTVTPIQEKSYASGEKVDIAVDTTDDYKFAYWEGDYPPGHREDPTITVVMDEDKELIAHTNKVWKRWELSVSAVPRNSGTVEVYPNGDNNFMYGDGTQVTLEAHPKASYVFDHWKGDVADPNSKTTTITMHEDETVKAVFEKVKEKRQEAENMVMMGLTLLIAGLISAGVTAYYYRRHSS